MSNDALQSLLDLSHSLGGERLRMAILGEGNTSLRLDAETFAVKASGSNLASLRAADLSTCRFDRLLPLLDAPAATDAEIDRVLFAARVNEVDKKPSIEALFHAYLLTLPGVACVGHVHAIAVNQILCSPRARDYAERRACPDEIVMCGIESVFVPYAEPGLGLAQSIRREVQAFVRRTGREPKIILLQNHGIIAVGPSPKAVLGSLLMAEKAAEIFVGAAALGGPVFLTAAQCERIAGRPDEHYRQKMLGL
ncbi:MAG: class II aldolase/adducin family protein [Verrucomicrobiae bacterium]|jgi:rhamnose utilization protein RhaD (predicted bifunctional aldolase and dehydrogenase)|nr:class II aldolase/adducin family protein [Verrucomicrobiae bacterium]